MSLAHVDQWKDHRRDQSTGSAAGASGASDSPGVRTGKSVAPPPGNSRAPRSSGPAIRRDQYESLADRRRGDPFGVGLSGVGSAVGSRSPRPGVVSPAQRPAPMQGPSGSGGSPSANDMQANLNRAESAMASISDLEVLALRGRLDKGAPYVSPAAQAVFGALKQLPGLVRENPEKAGRVATLLARGAVILERATIVADNPTNATLADLKKLKSDVQAFAQDYQALTGSAPPRQAEGKAALAHYETQLSNRLHQAQAVARETAALLRRVKMVADGLGVAARFTKQGAAADTAKRLGGHLETLAKGAELSGKALEAAAQGVRAYRAYTEMVELTAKERQGTATAEQRTRAAVNALVLLSNALGVVKQAAPPGVSEMIGVLEQAVQASEGLANLTGKRARQVEQLTDRNLTGTARDEAVKRVTEEYFADAARQAGR